MKGESNKDPFQEKLFEMRISDIYDRNSWLADEITKAAFIELFPVIYKKGMPLPPDKPVDFDLDRDLYLEILLAFRQSFR